VSQEPTSLATKIGDDEDSELGILLKPGLKAGTTGCSGIIAQRFR